MKQPHKRTALLFITLSMVAVLLLLIDMATGDTYIPISKVWAVLTGGECDEMTRNILLSIRFIRVVVAALIGVALSVSGLQMQTVFQNPLADPYLLGVSSGAGLGVALFILGAPLLGWTEFPVLQSLGIVGSGWVGTAAILLGVAIVSRKVKNILGVLIMGVMIGYVAGAIIQILQYLSSAEQLKMFTLWSMGSLSHITATQLGIMIPMLCLALPGSPPAAVMLSALQLQGIRPGPMLTSTNPTFTYEMAILLILGSVILWVVGVLIAKPVTKIIDVPNGLLMPIVAVLCVIGTYSLNISRFDLIMMFVFGIIGYILDCMQYPSASIVLGMLLGVTLDVNLRRALMVSDGSLLPFVTRPIAILFLLAILYSLLGPIISKKMSSKFKDVATNTDD